MAEHGTCHFCGEQKKLCKAHIVPQALYEPLLAKGVPKVFSSDPKEHPKKAPAGIYDQEILCADCDGYLGQQYDEPGIRFLRRPLSEFGDPAEIITDESFQVADEDGLRLKLFFASVLWRAHLSQRPMYADVSLGPFADQIKTALTSSADPGPQLEIALIRFEHPAAVSQHKALKTKTRDGGINGYSFSLPNYEFLAKVDSRSLPAEMGSSLIRSGKLFHVWVFDYRTSPNAQRRS